MVKSQLRRKQAVFINITLLQAIQSCILIAAFGFTSVSGHASERQDTFSQNTVTLQRLLEAASTNHPNLRAAQSFIQASQQDISSANRLRWPELSLVIESDQNKQPTSTPSRNARLQQTLWDFGRVSHLISESEVNSELAYIGKDLQELDLHLQIIKAWEDMLASNRRLTFARASLDTLNAFQAQMQRRVNAMASPSIDLELVESRLLQTQVEYNNAQSQLSHSLFVLEQLSGLSQLKHRLEAHAEPLPLARLKKLELEFQAADWPVLARSHPTVREAELEHQVALRQLDSQTAAQFPQIYLRIEKPLAKTQFNTNTVTNWYVGLNYTTGTGFTGLSQLKSQAFRIQAALEQIDSAQIQVARDMQSDFRDLTSAVSRLESLQRSVTASQNVLGSYQRQFQGGRKSWLDLLNAERELTQNKYLLADAEATSTGSAYRLLKRTQQMPLTPIDF